MTETLAYTLRLDLAVQDRPRVLGEAAGTLVRRGSFATVEEAEKHLAGDVSKAVPVLFDLHGLTAAGAVVLRIECGLDTA